jgi:hypothetical protein
MSLVTVPGNRHGGFWSTPYLFVSSMAIGWSAFGNQPIRYSFTFMAGIVQYLFGESSFCLAYYECYSRMAIFTIRHIHTSQRRMMEVRGCYYAILRPHSPCAGAPIPYYDCAAHAQLTQLINSVRVSGTMFLLSITYIGLSLHWEQIFCLKWLNILWVCWGGVYDQAYRFLVLSGSLIGHQGALTENRIIAQFLSDIRIHNII